MSLSHLESIEIQVEDDFIEVSGFKEELKFARHKCCDSSMDIHFIGSYNVMCCRTCYLRVKFPAYIKTLKRLKDYFEDKSYEKPDRFDLLNFEEEK